MLLRKVFFALQYFNGVVEVSPTISSPTLKINLIKILFYITVGKIGLENSLTHTHTCKHVLLLLYSF